MKAAALYIAIFAFALLTIPMIALNFGSSDKAQATVHTPVIPPGDSSAESSHQSEAAPAAVESLPDTPPEKPADPLADIPVSDTAVESLLILDESSGEVLEVSLRDYVRGAVAAEMPATFHTEALKAQAVAAHTFAVHNHMLQQQNPDPALKGAAFAADPGNLKVFMREQEVREFYGEKFEASWSKICKAADSALPYVLEYDDYPIVAAYHAISAGQTETASNVWEGSAPYLLTADSAGDLLAPGYESTVEVSAEDARALLQTAYPDIALGQEPESWFGEATRSESGYVLEQQVGDLAVHGKEIRQIFGLRSHNYDLLAGEDGFTFQVYGYGHGVGMSQYGADYLARQGYTFDQILENYYTGAVLKRTAQTE